MKIKIILTKKQLIIALALLVVGVLGWMYLKHHNPSGKFKASTSDFGGMLQHDQQTATTANPASSAEIAYIQDLAKQKGGAAAYAYLKDQWKNKQAQGHDLAHVVGRLLYQEQGIKGLAVCDSNFAFGCYHGFLEDLVKKQGEGGLASAEQGCKDLGLPGVVASCIHGIGHGVLGYKGDITAALPLCQQFPQTESSYCFDGAFMEYYNGIMESSTKISIDYSNPWKFCLGMINETQGQCVRNQIFYMLNSTPEKLAPAIKTCAQLTDSLKTFCITSVGLFATQHSEGNPKSAGAVCKNFSASVDQNACVTGSAQEFVFEQFPVATARQLCSSLDQVGSQVCLNAVEGIAKDYGRK